MIEFDEKGNATAEKSARAVEQRGPPVEPDPKGAGRPSSAVIHRAGINRAGDRIFE
jgi:hypothetical protein